MVANLKRGQMAANDDIKIKRIRSAALLYDNIWRKRNDVRELTKEFEKFYDAPEDTDFAREYFDSRSWKGVVKEDGSGETLEDYMIDLREMAIKMLTECQTLTDMDDTIAKYSDEESRQDWPKQQEASRAKARCQTKCSNE